MLGIYAITEFYKVVFTGNLMYYWETSQSNKVLFSAIVVAFLFSLSIAAEVFVLSISPAKQEATLAQFEQKRAVLEKNVEDKKAFVQTVSWKKHCSDDCRKLNWEARHGKKWQIKAAVADG